MKFCPLFTGCAVVVVAYRSASVVGVLTKEKLRHYLAFECAIREIAAVSDRHCLATDNPRTSVATISLSLSLGQIYARCSFPLASLAPPPASSFTQLSRVPCTRRVLTQIPSPPIAFSLALCLMNAHSNILSRRVQRFLSLAKTGHSREPLQPVLFLLSITFTIIRITRITFVFFFFLSYVSSDSRSFSWNFSIRFVKA